MFEANLAISLLKLTQKGPVEQELVYSDAHMPADYGAKLLQKMQNANLVNFNDGLIRVDARARLALAVHVAQHGADIEQVSRHLNWREFESITAVALELNAYLTQKNVHFTHQAKRWEIDVVGYRKPLVLCVDCKHWSRGMHPSTLQKIAREQTLRTQAFADLAPKGKIDAGILRWEKAVFVPIVLSLVPFSQKFVDQVPVVPVLSVQDFIGQLPFHLGSVCHFFREFLHLGHDFE